MDKAPIFKNAELLDAVIGEIQKGLIKNIPWLDYAFGRAERVVRLTADERKKLYLPNVYAGQFEYENEYIDVTPDSNLGNFCFFYVDDPQSVEWESRNAFKLSVRVSIIFWYDYRKIFDDATTRNKGAVKREILDTISQRLGMSKGRITIDEIYEKAENIYEGFTLDEVDNQFLIHPFGGLRFDGTIDVMEICIP